MNIITIPIKKNKVSAVTPAKSSDTAVGYDLYSLEDVNIFAGETHLIKCGFAVAVPEGYCMMIVPRSGLALKESITVLNSPGIVDPDYRGEIGVILHKVYNKIQQTPTKVIRGDKIAQAVFVKYCEAKFIEVPDLEETKRGVGGFGSTGK